MIKKILLLILSTKISILILIFLSYNLLPSNNLLRNSNFVYPINEKISLTSAYKTWDAQHYLYLSQKGYSSNGLSNRFFPFLPVLISIANVLFKNPVVSGLVVSNVLSFLGLLYLFFFCKLFFKDEDKAFRSVLLFLAFPTAFFISLIYSESALIFLTSGFFYYLYSKKYFIAALFVFFIPLTRPVGILITIPYFIYWTINIWQLSKFKANKFIFKLLTIKETYYLISPILGFLVYLFFMRISTGSFLEGITALGYTVGTWSISNFTDPIYFLVNLFSSTLAIHGFTNSIIDRVFFILYCFSLILIYKRLDKTMFFYALALGMVPLFGSFMSYTRYVLMVFPVFMVLAIILNEKKYTLFFYPILFFMNMLQALFLVMYALNFWVA